jgi:RNA polymerase sigma-70 factor, ECF subfamily
MLSLIYRDSKGIFIVAREAHSRAFTLRGSLTPDTAMGHSTFERALFGSFSTIPRMWKKPKPAAPNLSPSKARASTQDSEPSEAQLSESDRVDSNVSSVALNHGLLAGAGQAAAGVDASAVSDAEVMLRVKAGDQQAFDYLVQKYRRPIISFMYRMAHNSATAEELAQEVFLRVYRSRENYEPSAKFSTWLYRIATNLGVNHARDTRHERAENTVNLDEPDTETGQTPDVADKTPTVEEEILRRERLTAIRQKVEALPERQKMAVLMHKYQQMDYRQIADVLKLSESATKSLLFRAYETLRTQLKEFI